MFAETREINIYGSSPRVALLSRLTTQLLTAPPVAGFRDRFMENGKAVR